MMNITLVRIFDFCRHYFRFSNPFKPTLLFVAMANLLNAGLFGQVNPSDKLQPWDNISGRQELTVKRDRNTKHFLNIDGSVSAFISAGSIHYNDGQSWRDINNDIVANTGDHSKTHPFCNESNIFSNYFPADLLTSGIITRYQETKINERIVSIDFVDVNGLTISSILLDQSGRDVAINNNEISYSFTSYDVEFVYGLHNDRRKFGMRILSTDFLQIIPAGAVKLLIREEVGLNKPVEISTDEKGICVKCEGINILRYSTPVCFDQNTNNGEYAGSISASPGDKGIYIESSFSIDWIKSAQRVFPLVLDPVVDYLPDNVSGWTGTQTSAGTSVFGPLSVRSGTNDYRAWAKFNISSIPLYSQILFASYYGYHYQGSNTDPQRAMVRKLTIDPPAVTDAVRWNAIAAGIQLSSFFVFGDSAANFGWKSVSLNAMAIAHLDSVIPQGWFALGFTPVTGGATQAYHYGYNAPSNVCYLRVNYSEECVGAPVGGNATGNGMTSLNVCSGETISLKASGYSAGTPGLSHIWQSAPNMPGPWSPISGATADTLAVAVTSNVFFRYLTTCSFSNLSTPTNVVSVTVSALPIPPAASGDTAACGQSVILNASGSTGKYLWFEDSGGTQLAGTGGTFVTPALYADKTYYLAATTADLSLIGTDYEFKNCGASGHLGPTLQQAIIEYAGTPLAGAVSVTGNGIQVWTVPFTGTYRITAKGAQGGNDGGPGAMMSGDFDLQAGQKLHILVGQKGSAGYFAANKIYASGGGGSFVTKEGAVDENDILLIAGGGGGACPVNDSLAPPGKASMNGSSGVGFSGGKAGGTAGNGGMGTSAFGGGGGFRTDATYDGPSGNTGGKSYLNGGAGGTGSLTAFIAGGFGGGGGSVLYQAGHSYRYAGAGGGYSGGGSSYSTDSLNIAHGASGGGGGSFNNGDDQDNQADVNYGHGSVTATLILPGGCLSSPLLPVTVEVTTPTPPVIIQDTTINCGQSVKLFASGSTGNYVWFSDSTGTNVVGTGQIFQTPALQTTTKYFVAATTAQINGAGLTYHFNNCGKTGRLGPAQPQIDSAYAGTHLDGLVTVIGSGIQKWTAPVTGKYYIEACGAEGGKNPMFYVLPGKGARMTGYFNLNSGDVLRLLVGQRGGINGSAYGGQGGGGGSFVVKEFGNSVLQMFDGTWVIPLLVAGGGAGAPNNSSPYPLEGRIDTRGYNFVSAGNSNSNGGGGGGSFAADGGGATVLKGYSFLSGGEGGMGTWAYGGFGGGGSKGGSFSDGAGAGGYDGGDFVDTGGANVANGGGSFNSGDNQVNAAGVHSGDGYITIQSMFPPGCFSALVPVTVTVNPLPDPIVTGVQINCGDSALLTVSGGNYECTWFQDSSATVVLGMGSAFITPELYQDITYYVAFTNQACTSKLVSVFVDVNTNVAAPTGTGGINSCGGSVMLSASGSTGNYIWYSDSSGTNVVGTGPVFNTPPLAETTVYYLAATTANFSGAAYEYFFSHCGATGATGPGQQQSNIAYTGTTLDGDVTVIGDGIQQWTVPATGVYRIEAFGAEGGKNPLYFALPGKGARMAGNFELDSGDVIRVLVGQQGGINGSAYGGQGGGGGSFVVKKVPSSVYQMFDGIYVDPLMVAGGGAGAPNSSSWYPVDARTDTRGHNYLSAGNSNTNGGGGGGSFSVNGGGATTLKGLSFLSGGLGGAGTWAYGGFGCGGSKGGSFSDGGGGGGFDGGDYVNPSGTNIANGGGSFNAGDFQSNAPGMNAGHGAVIITYMSAPGCISTLVPVTAEIIPLSAPVTENNGPVCEGDTLALTSMMTFPGTYSWTGPGGYTSMQQNPVVSYNSTPAMSGTYTVTFTSGICHSFATTNAIVNANLPAGVTITANPPGGICTGDNVTFTAVPVNGGSTPSYSWYSNGSPIGNNSNVLTVISPSHGDQIYCVMSSSLECVSGSPATSNTIVLTVASSLPAGVMISSNPPSPVCAGSQVTFTATPINGGSTPSYQWFRNGMSVGGNSSTFTTSSLNNGDQVYCIMGSSLTCATGSPATSNVLIMTVNPTPPASLTINSTPSGAICYGDNVVFTASPVNGGTTPAYQWYLNGVAVGSNSSAYSNNALNNGDQVSCTVTSSLVCVSGSPASSGTITMSVTQPVPVSVAVISNPAGPICYGDNVVFTASPLNGGTTPLYQWYLNGVAAGSNSSTYSNSTLNNGDQIYCTITSSQTCVSGSPAYSDTSIMTVNPRPVVELGPDTTICENHTLLLDAGAGPGYTYFWSDGTGNQTLLVDGSLAGTGTWLYTVQVENAFQCEKIDSIYITVDLCTAVADGNTGHTIEFFPNPVDDMLYILIQGEIRKETEVWLTDITGRKIYHNMISGIHSLQINMQNFAPGIYLMRVVNGNEEIFGKVVKN